MCPGCGGAVEMLRAGHVAFLDGTFRYFCSAECKRVWFDAHEKVAALSAATAEPPRVAPVSGAGPRFPASGARAAERGTSSSRSPTSELRSSEPEASEPPPPPASEPRRERSSPVPAVRAATVPDAPPESEPSPDTLASPKVERLEVEAAAFPVVAPLSARERRVLEAPPAPADDEPLEDAPVSAYEAFPDAAASAAELDDGARPSISAPAPVPRTARARAEDALGIASALFAVLALVVPLADEIVASLAPPFAVLAGLGGATWLVVGRRRPRPGVHPLVLCWPLALGAAATASRMLGDAAAFGPRVPSAAFTAVATLVALVLERFVDGAFAELADRRARTEALLARPAEVERDGALVSVPAAEVRPGERVHVRAGEAVPVDGVVVEGADVRPWPDLTASRPVRAGDAAVAGGRVTAGELVVTAATLGADRLAARFYVRGGEAEIPTVRLLRRASEVGAPAIGALVGAAVALMHGGVVAAVTAVAAAGFVVAVASAPATAGLVFGRAVLAARRRGIFYRDPAAVERAGEVGFAVLCSRGTVLLGEPQIVGIEPVGPLGEDAVLALAAGAELTASHPFAEAVVRAARARGLEPEPVRSVIVAEGLGVTALAASGDEVVVGSRALMLRERVAVAAGEAAIAAGEAQGRSVLFVALSGKLVGLLLLQDGLRPGARAAVHRLHEAHVEPVLLSGESRETSETIARSLGIEHARPEVLPQDRGAEVRALGEGGELVAVVGHPSRDDAALAAADVSVAMGAPATGAVEWSVVLAGDDVRDAALALTLSRAARERARGAVLFGAVPALVGAAALAFGLAPPTALPPLGLLGALLGVSWVRDAFRAD